MLKEQDKEETILLISYLLQRLSKLYQLVNWSEDNAVLLAEWIYDNYKFDSLDDVITCLKNPPHTEHKQWRLTPDTIQEWMKIILDKAADVREKELKKFKELFVEPLDDVNYEAFKSRIEKEGPPPDRPDVSDKHYEAFRMKYLTQREKKDVSET